MAGLRTAQVIGVQVYRRSQSKGVRTERGDTDSHGISDRCTV